MPHKHKERQEQISEEMEFNKLLLALPQEFKKKIFCVEDLKDFLETQRQLQESAYVIFKFIPPNLKEIITKDRPYLVYNVEGSKVRLFLDNDFQHWIDKKNVYLCPKNQVQRILLTAKMLKENT